MKVNLTSVVSVLFAAVIGGAYGASSDATAVISDSFNRNYFIGSNSIVSTNWVPYRVAPFDNCKGYSKDGCDMLTEFREAVTSTRINQFKFKFNPTSCNDYQMKCANKDSAFTLSDLAKEPEMVATFADQRLKWYFMWMTTYSLPKPLNVVELTDSRLDAEYNEMYNWAVDMLKKYENTNKVFFVGHWEGDWALMMASGCGGGFDLYCVPTPESIDKYIRWSQVRQDAITDAKAKVKATGVDIFHYIEFNLGAENYETDPKSPNSVRPTILNSVVPFVNPDFVSFSSFKLSSAYKDLETGGSGADEQDQMFWEILDYAESKLGPTQTNFSAMMGLEKRVFVGEFGPKLGTEPKQAVITAAQIFRAALTWGCPFILQWAVYDNDSTVPLVPRDNGDMYSNFTPIRQLFKNWVEASDTFVTTYKPTQNELRIWAASWFGWGAYI